MKGNDWIKEFCGAITVCDKKGVITAMNDKAIKTFVKEGGKKLIGTNVLDCHPETSKTKLKKMIKNRTTNCYTIEKKGVKKLIYQSPWYKNRKYMGFLELSLEIPLKIKHFLRK